MIDPHTLIDGRYEVLQRVGSGGMADVYLCADQLLGRQVAVKVLHHRFAEDQEFVERFRREASSAAGLSHPNVVGIFDRGAWDGTFYIAMEYLPGHTLKQIVKEHGALQPASAVDVVVQVLRAARFAHRRGVIHRDLKPHNVILDEEGRAKVTDFGIARAGASDMTLTGSIMGTAQYLSPEQAQGHAVSEASDLYAVGVVLYELLTGRVPFDGETAVTIALQHISTEPPPPSACVPGIPAELDAVVLKALAKDPRERYVSADDFIAALEHLRPALPAPAEGHALAFAPPAPETPFLVPPPAGPAGMGDAPAPGGALGAVAGAAGAAGAAAFGAAGFLAAEDAPTGAAHWPAPVGAIPSYNRNGGSTGSLVPVAAEGAPEPGGGGPRRRMLPWIAAGTVLALVAAGVLLVLLLPSGRVTVPDVTEDTQSLAASVLRRAGLTMVPEYAISSHVPKGRVVTETPAAGTSVKSGSKVVVVVSEGRGEAEVPKVEGLTEEEALLRISEAGLRARTPKQQASESVAAGDVISTSPAAGKRLQKGKEVTLYVSTGPPLVRVPTVTRELLANAEETLVESELGVGTIKHRRDGRVPDNTVLEQTPQPGKKVKPGYRVRLVVSEAPAGKGKATLVTVPSVVGKHPRAAEAALTKAGLSPSVRERAVSEPVLVGTVVKQSPTAGNKARKGSTVEIFVGVSKTSSTTSSTTSSSTSSTSSTTSSTTSTSTSTSTTPPGS